jgi:O-antigen ligase
MGGRAALAGFALVCLLAFAGLASAAVVVPGAPDLPPDPPPAAVAPPPAPPAAPAPAQVDPAEQARQAEAQARARARERREARERIARVGRLSDGAVADERHEPPPASPIVSVAEHSAISVSVLERLLPFVLFFSLLAAIVALVRLSDPAWALTIGIVLTVFSGNWGELGLPPLDRLFIGLGVLAMLIPIGPPGERPRLKLGFVHVLLVATAAYAVLSAVWAGTIGDSEAYFGLIDRLGLAPFLMFAIAPLAFRTRRQRSILLGGLVALGGYLGLTALFETINLDALVFPGYILDPSVGIHVDRARGPFVEAAAFGLGLFVCGVAALVAAATWRDLRLRVFATGVAALCMFGTVFTLTRAIWLSSVIAALVALLVARELRRYLLPSLAVGAVAVLAALAFVPSLQDDAQARQADQRPIWDRYNLLAAGERMIAEKPLFGFGWDTADEEITDYFRQADTFPLTGDGLRIHNVFVANAVELGLVGAALWVVTLLAAIGTAILRRGPPELRPWRIGLIAVAVQWLIVANFVPLFFAFPNMILWVWAGVLSTQYVEGGEDLFAIPKPERTEAPSPELIIER